jgi:inosine/xanthosine triphosphate pyrophosphatase family protein
LKSYYGKDTIFIIGNAVIPSLRHIISTPNKGLKRLLKKHFEVYQMDEFRTSCLDYRTTDDNLIRNRNCKIMMKNGKKKKLHSVLVSKILNRSSGCYINSYQQRDKNSVKNIKKIVKQYLKNKTRPYWYRRDIKLPDKKACLEEGGDCLRTN